MRKRSLTILISLLMVSPLFITGCTRDDVAIVRIQLVNVPQGTAMNANSVFERVFRWFVPNAWAAAGWSSTRTSLEIRLSSSDLVEVITPIPLSTTDITMEIPAGPNRKISVFAYTTSGAVNKNWGGHVELDLTPGDEKTVQIDMLPMTKISYLFGGSTDVQIQWEIVGQLYGIQGYRIYRSEDAEGPYQMIKEVLPPTVGSSYDIPEHGKTYYYKVCVFTTLAEGELSSYQSTTF